MATRIAPAPIARTLAQISAELHLDTGGASDRVSDDAELRADKDGLRAKPLGKSASVPSGSARAEHRTLARETVLLGLRQSLMHSYPKERREDVLGTAVKRATVHLRTPADGKAFTVGHLRSLSAYAQRIHTMHIEHALPLLNTQEVIHFIDQELGGKLPDAVVMEAMCHLIHEDPNLSARDAHSKVMAQVDAAKRDGKTLTLPDPEADATRIHLPGRSKEAAPDPSTTASSQPRHD